MFEFTIIIICVVTIILLKFFLNIRFKEMKKLNQDHTENLDKIATKFPSDEQICKEILHNLKHESTKIQKDENYSSCLYTVFNHTITIGKFQKDYMKIQTIAHECLHACQNKKILWTNFIFTNLYLLYFAIILFLTFFNWLPDTNIHLFVFIFLSFIQYIVRLSLENDAMIKAKYVAKEYLDSKKEFTKLEKKELLEEYERVNQLGIPFMNYYLISMNLVKVILYAFVILM